DWDKLLAHLEDPAAALASGRKHGPQWHHNNLVRVNKNGVFLKPDEVLQVVIIATYNEQRDVLEPTIQSVLATHYDHKKVMLVLAYEERGGERVERQSIE